MAIQTRAVGHAGCSASSGKFWMPMLDLDAKMSLNIISSVRVVVVVACPLTSPLTSIDIHPERGQSARKPRHKYLLVKSNHLYLPMRALHDQSGDVLQDVESRKVRSTPQRIARSHATLFPRNNEVSYTTPF
nr:hypothetical protein CFP56_53344 [Quercus suber]